MPNVSLQIINQNIVQDTFAADVANCSYPSWTLRDISLWHGGSEVDVDVMHLFAGCVPSIRRFWGQEIMIA